MSKRIGIFSGTFDPVHKGHIAFALQAVKEAALDVVYFMPEPKPRRKEGVTHYAHRIAMLEIALKPYPKLRVQEVSDKQFSVAKTMPRLKKLFSDDLIFLLVGSDAASYLADSDQWPNAAGMLREFGIIVGIRGDADVRVLSQELLGITDNFVLVSTDKQHASSRKIRTAAAQNQHHEDSLHGTKKYMKLNWLYSAVPREPIQ